MFSIKRWRQSIKEKDKKRQDTLGRLLHTCLFLPFTMFTVKFVNGYYEWTLLSFCAVILAIVLLGYITEDAIFRALGKYGFKIVKAPYSYMISLTVVLSFMYIVLGR